MVLSIGQSCTKTKKRQQNIIYMVTIAILALFQILVSYLFFVQKVIYMVIFKKNTLFLMVIGVYVYFFQLTSEVGNFCLGTIAPYAEEFCSGRILPIHHCQKFPI